MFLNTYYLADAPTVGIRYILALFRIAMPREVNRYRLKENINSIEFENNLTDREDITRSDANFSYCPRAFCTQNVFHLHRLNDA